MADLRHALVVSAVATGTAAATWALVRQWRRRTEQLGGARASLPLHSERSRTDEIEELTQQQKDLMLREFADHV